MTVRLLQVVCSEPSSNPKRILDAFSSRAVSVRRTWAVCSFIFPLITRLPPVKRTARSSMKSPQHGNLPPLRRSAAPVRWFLIDLQHLADVPPRCYPFSWVDLSEVAHDEFLTSCPRRFDQLIDGLDHVPGIRMVRALVINGARESPGGSTDVA